MLRSEITALQDGKADPISKDSTSPAVKTGAAAPTRDKTLAYWKQLNEIAVRETALQQDAESTFKKSNAAKVFEIKGRVSRFAAKEVAALPKEAVDSAALGFGKQLERWYNDGGELYEQAVRIWETPMGPQPRAELNEEWKQSDHQHHNEAQLLFERATAVRGTLNRVYGDGFPVFDKPTGAAEKSDAKPGTT